MSKLILLSYLLVACACCGCGLASISRTTSLPADDLNVKDIQFDPIGQGKTIVKLLVANPTAYERQLRINLYT